MRQSACPEILAKCTLSRYTWTPIILRAVSRTFRDCIDGSSELLRLRLQAVYPLGRHEQRMPCREQLGALKWLEGRGEFFFFIEYQKNVSKVVDRRHALAPVSLQALTHSLGC